MQKSETEIPNVNTDDDVLNSNGYSLDSFNKWCEGLQEHERAMRFLELLVKALNGDWVPDFNNPGQRKYEPRFSGGSSKFQLWGVAPWRSHSGIGSRFCLKELALAVHAGKNFTEWYRKAIYA